MKYFWVAFILFMLAGCTQYTRVEQLELGMTKDEVMNMTSGCSYRGESENFIQYSCKLDVPSGKNLDKRAVRPFILSFEKDKLKKIMLDEQALQREAIRYRHDYLRGHYFYY